jgi:hypothetical protein
VEDILRTEPISQALGTPEFLAAVMLCHFRERCDGFWRLVDQPTHENGADYFCDNGILALGPLRLEGRAAINEFLVARTAGKHEKREFTRHVTSNYQLVELLPKRAVVRSILAVYSGAGDVPAASAAPSSMGDVEDVLVREGDGQWRFEERTGTPLFVGYAAAPFLKRDA